MLEKRLIAVPPQLLTTDGTANGKLTIVDSTLFKVKQVIFIRSNTLEPIELEIKRIEGAYTIYLGPLTQTIDKRSNLVIYTVASGAYIYSNEQKRPSIPQEEFNRAVYEEEPIVAQRTILVDQHGDHYKTNNPFPVKLSDGSINIGTVNAQIEVALSHQDNVPTIGDIHDSVRIGDGINEATITKVALGTVAGLNTVRLNSVFSKPFNKLTVLSKDDDGNPLSIRSSYLGTAIQLAAILYDIDGDFLDIEVSDL